MKYRVAISNRQSPWVPDDKHEKALKTRTAKYYPLLLCQTEDEAMSLITHSLWVRCNCRKLILKAIISVLPFRSSVGFFFFFKYTQRETTGYYDMVAKEVMTENTEPYQVTNMTLQANKFLGNSLFQQISMSKETVTPPVIKNKVTKLFKMDSK